MRHWRNTALLGLSLLLSPGPSGWIAPSAVTVAAVGAGTMVAGYAEPAEARASSRSGSVSRSSGGYSRPSSSSSRTPSFSAPSSSSSSSSSGSGGYRRPSVSPSVTPSQQPSQPSSGSQSSADRAMSRSQSGEALDRYRAQQAPPPVARQAPSSQAPSSQATIAGQRRSDQPQDSSGSGSGWSWGGGWGGGSWGGSSGRRGENPPPPPPPAWNGWGPGRGWAPPRYAYNTPRRFGIWEGLFLWFLLDNLTRPGYADFFHNHRDDPGYQQWRSEAEQRAKSDVDLRARLDQLDASLAEKKGQPANPAYLPPDTPREVAVADGGGGPGDKAGASPAKSGSGAGLGLVLAVVLVGGGALVVLWLARRRRNARTISPTPSTSAVDQAGRILKEAVSDVPYKPSLFRIGMTLTADPTPFILAGTATKVNVPEVTGAAGGLVSVESVGTLSFGGTTYHRLYLPGGHSLFQLHLGADGQPDECRCFSLIEEVTPADAEEWGFWLDSAEGMIGWPEFQTKDGKLYARHWAPGSARIEPRASTETIESVTGKRGRTVRSMLYSAPTGAASPAPETEYLLVSAIEEGGQAWVELLAGIDVNPSSLSLA